MRKLSLLLVAGIFAAGLLAGCGDKSGTPSSAGSESRRSSAMRNASTYDPMKDAAVQVALKTHPDYKDQFEEEAPPAPEPSPEASDETGTGETKPPEASDETGTGG